MEYEYEGRTEREAIEMAAADLSLDRDQFDVEVLEAQKGTLFKKGYVRIRVSVFPTPGGKDDAEDSAQDAEGDSSASSSNSRGSTSRGYSHRDTHTKSADMSFGASRPLADPAPKDDFEKSIIEFVTTMIQKMGYEAKVAVLFRESEKVGFKIDSADCAVLIGRKGATLDALQLLVNVYASRIGHNNMKIILDAENYRIHREEVLVRLAYNTADRVASTHRSFLLEPMNPFERRIIHTTLSDVPNIQTKSEGDGVYKRVRVQWRGVR